MVKPRYFPSIILLAALCLPLTAEGPEATSVSPPFAVYRDGEISEEEFQAWAASRGGSKGPARGGKPREMRQLEQLVLLRVLGARFAADPALVGSEYSAWLRLLRDNQASDWLRKKVSQEFSVPEADLRSLYADERERYRLPERWRLRNIYKSLPKDAVATDQRALRASLEAIRARILGGEDFSHLARQESESQTRLRGGRMGIVALREVRAEVGKELLRLEEGALSPVIEGKGGYTLLYCDERFPARDISFEAARETLSQRLKNREFPLRWRRQGEALLRHHAPTFAPRVDEKSPMDLPVVSFVGQLAPISNQELAFFLRDRGAGEVPWRLSAEALLRWQKERALLAVRHAEAEAQGFSRDPAMVERLHWETLRLQASMVEDRATLDSEREPVGTELRQLFEKNREALVAPAQFHLRTFAMTVDLGAPAHLHERFLELGDAVAAGRASFDSIAEALAGKVQVEDLGWLIQGQIFNLGLNAEVAIGKLAVGASTAAVQEGRELSIYQLVETKAERPLSFEEAYENLYRSVRKANRMQARRKFRAAQLAAQAPRILSVSAADLADPAELKESGQ